MAKYKWTPDLGNVPQPIPSYHLLRKAVWTLYNKGIITNPYETLKDAHGIYGFRYGQFLVVAKKELYGNVVSVHEAAILCARMHRVGILLWLDSAGKFYWFDPEQLDREGERNLKGSAVMVNFNIKLGRDPW